MIFKTGRSKEIQCNYIEHKCVMISYLLDLEVKKSHLKINN